MIIFAVAAVLAIAGLWAPLRLQAGLENRRYRISVRYLGLRITLEGRPDLLTFALWDRALWSGPVEGRHRKQKAGERRPRVEAAALGVRGIWRRRGVLRAFHPVVRRAIVLFLRLSARLWRAWRLERGRIALHVGCGDPALTGMMTGYFHAARMVTARRWPDLLWEWNPDFRRAVFEMQVQITLRIIPIRPMYHILQVAVSMPWRGLWKLKRAWASETF